MTIDRRELADAGAWLQQVYQTELLRPEGLWIDGHPDWEGIGAWLFDTYVNARERGASPAAARDAVLGQIRGSQEWRDKHPPAPGSGLLTSRGPLPAFPPGSYDRDIPAVFASGTDKLIYRGNFCGLRVPGAPGVPGGVNFTRPGGDTSLVMAAHLDRYPREIQQAYLSRTAAYGYTHVQQSIGHSVEAGQSIEAFVATQKIIQAAGLFADVWFLGGPGFTDRDQDAAHWRPRLDPWIDALLANGAIDTACVGWQLDQYNKESDSRTGNGPIQSIIDYLADRLAPHGIPIGTHWVNEAGAWCAPMDRFAWWKRQRNRLTWFHHQGDVRMAIPDYQAKLVDTLQPFGDGRMGTSGLFGDRPFGLTIFECSAQAQFDEQTTEDEGDLRGLLLCCTKAASPVAGYGNGARRQDGRAL